MISDNIMNWVIYGNDMAKWPPKYPAYEKERRHHVLSDAQAEETNEDSF
jgi:hypothetical protein